MRIILIFLLASAASMAQQTTSISIGMSPYGVPKDIRRDPWQKPDVVINSLKFSPAETVAVVETGYPYFAQRVAPLVKAVYAVNSDPRAFQGPGKLPPTIKTVLSTSTDPHLPNMGVDTVILVEVLRLVPQRLLFYISLLSELKPRGRLVIIDRNLPQVVPSTERLTDAQLQSELALVGFKVVQRVTDLQFQYFLVFQRL